MIAGRPRDDTLSKIDEQWRDVRGRAPRIPSKLTSAALVHEPDGAPEAAAAQTIAQLGDRARMTMRIAGAEEAPLPSSDRPASDETALGRDRFIEFEFAVLMTTLCVCLARFCYWLHPWSG